MPRRVADDDERGVWQRWGDATESVGRRTAILKLAQPLMIVRGEELDATPQLLNTPTGTVDLANLTLKPHDPLDLITHITRASFNPPVQWSEPLYEFQRTFVPEPGYWDYLMKILGSMLYGGNHFRIWTIMHGTTTTGKSQLVETIARAVGDYAVPVGTSVFRANQDDKPRPDLLRALSARFVYASEGADAWELHGDHVKRMSGGDPLTARGMRSNVMVERVPDFTPLIVCNTVPKVKGADSGVKRRLHVLPFPHSVAAAEDTRKREIFSGDPNTLDALLTQLIIGCARAYNDEHDVHGADRPQTWVEATAKAFGDLTSVGEFISFMEEHGYLVHDPFPLSTPWSNYWKAEDLYRVYKQWVHEYGSTEEKRTQLSHRVFNGELRGMGWESHVSGGTRWAGKLAPLGSLFII
jgi:putative DNA primase/helicase